MYGLPPSNVPFKAPAAQQESPPRGLVAFTDHEEDDGMNGGGLDLVLARLEALGS